jgi:hypothetical protein
MTPDVTRQSRSRDFTASVICNGAYIHVPSRLDTTVRIYVLDTTVRIYILDTTVRIYDYVLDTMV